MPTSSPVVRSLRVLSLIQAHPGITAAILAERLGVTDRAVRRYVGALRLAGLTVDSMPGLGGGYRLARGIRTPLLFSEEELVAVTMVLSEVPNGVADEPARSAVAKILGALPSRIAGAAQAVLDTAIAVPDASQMRPLAAIVLELVSAIEQTRAVEMTYRSVGRSHVTSRIVEPWALVVRHRRWYLLASHTGALRTYRVDRIQELAITETCFERPVDLDPTQLFERHLQTSWTHPTHVEIRASLAQASPWIPFTMGELTALGPDRCRLTGRTNNCAAYLIDLANTPYAFEVVGGDELRATAQRILQGIAVRPAASAENVRPSTAT